MRFKIFFSLVMIVFPFWSNAQYLPPEKALKAFQAHRTMIEGYDGRVCWTAAVVTGDLNLDGYPDAVVQYGCGGQANDPRHGIGWAVFLNEKGKLKLVTKDEKVVGIVPYAINTGIIEARKLNRSPTDTCKFRFEKNKLVRLAQ